MVAAPPGIGPDGNAVGSHCGAGSHPLTVPEPNPTILTSPHETKAGTRLAAEFETPGDSTVEQEHREQAIAFHGVDRDTVDGQA